MARLDDRPRLSAAITVLMAVVVLMLAWGDGGPTAARAAIGNATGPLVADSLGGGAILNAGNMAPGDTTTGEITVTNVGDTAGAMVLQTSDLTDVTAAGGVLSRTLDLTVLDVTPGRRGAVVYFGKLADLQSAALGNFDQGEGRRYRFVVTYPAGLAPGADDALQGASTRVSFIWAASGAATTPADQNGNQNGDTGGNGGLENHVQQSANPPALKIRVYVRVLQAAHRKRVYVNVYCSRRCTLTATGVASLPSQKKRWKLTALRGSVTKPGTVKFRMPLPARALAPLNTALLHRRHGSVKLTITARSGARTVHWTRTVRLAR